MKTIVKIQQELKAPKNQYNSFGKYKYRSSEDILLALKPLLSANNCILIISDEITQVGDRIYIKSTATIKETNKPLSEGLSVSAFAREPDTKKE